MKPAIEMPTDFYAQQEFEPQRVDYSAPEASGRVGGVQAGFPLWLAVWTFDVLGRDESEAIQAFSRGLRGATRRFLGRDIFRQFPKLYPRGFAGMTRSDASPFDGSATAWSEAINADGDNLVTLEGLPPGFTLSRLDQIDFRYDATDDGVTGLPWRCLVAVQDAATADGTGAVTVSCEPPIPSAVPVGAVAHLDEPACIMVQVTDQSKLGPVGKRIALQSGQIVGLQDIRA